MRRKAGALCMVLGAALVLAALSLFLWNRHQDQTAGEAAVNLLPQIVAEIQAPPQETGDETTSTAPTPYDPTMTQVKIDGYGYIGYLSIPALELELPIMADWDYERLQIAPCRYTGSTKTDDLVLAGHNFVRHFGYLSKLAPGDQVLFTDMDGTAWIYEVAVVEVLAPTAVEEMASGEYDLTLFTCTYGGQSRVTVRCDRAMGSAGSMK